MFKSKDRKGHNIPNKFAQIVQKLSPLYIKASL